MSDFGFQWIKSLKKQTGRNIPDLLALSRQRDPFFIGSKKDRKRAEWFARMWEQQYHHQTGLHLRRIHYRLDAISFPKLKGMPYKNVKGDWLYLLEASRCARLLRLVPADAFIDRRNDEPRELNWNGDALYGNLSLIPPLFSWDLPSLGINLSSADWTIDAPQVSGYFPNDYRDRAYYIELWIEKSTMNDILVPLTNELGVRLVPSSGFQSITNAVKLLQRAREIGKPCRVFYVSDHDGPGRKMPIAVARQLEFWRDTYAPEADVKLTPLVLTEEQIAQYHLPKNIDRQGAVELDALEAIVPGELARIVRDAVAPYIDETISKRLQDASVQAWRLVHEEWASHTATEKQKLKALQKRVDRVTKKYKKQTTALNKRLARDLAQFKKPLARLRADATSQANNFRPNLPPRPEPVTPEIDESHWLFASSRSYEEQLAAYKKRT
jgi:hypothetical protein